MKRCAVLMAVVFAALALGSCARDQEPASALPRAQPSGPVRIVAENDANLHLWVSNQSFADPTVVIKVSIDGVEVIARPFKVESQHNWILFPVLAPEGSHVLDVVTDTQTTMRQTFTLPQSGRQYAVVNYWNYPSDGGRKLTWNIQSTPVGFD